MIKIKIKVLIFFVAGLLIADRLTKWLVLKYPDFYSSQFFDLRLFKNTKLYSISLNPYLLYFLIGGVLLIFIILFFNPHYLKKGVRARTKERFLKFGLALIILGGLSNFFDRIYFGYVIDYFRIFILPISIFNIADLMIIAGVILIIFNTFLIRLKVSKDS